MFEEKVMKEPEQGVTQLFEVTQISVRISGYTRHSFIGTEIGMKHGK
jgi:hypothetical protein